MNEQLNNQILIKSIEFWQSENPKLKINLQNKSIYMLIFILDRISERKKINYKVLIDFIEGFSIYDKELFNEENSKEALYFNDLTKPAFDIIVKYLKSDFREFLVEEVISGERILDYGSLKIPISHKEIMIFIDRINSFPFKLDDIDNLQDDFIKINDKKYKIKTENFDNKDIQQKQTSLNKQIPELKPKFKTEEINKIFDILKIHFSNSQYELLKNTLKTGNLPPTKLNFNGSANVLLDFFKQLIKGHILTVTVQKDFEIWVSSCFEFFYKGKYIPIKPKYASRIMSGSERAAKGNRLINVEKINDKFEIITLELRNREQKD